MAELGAEPHLSPLSPQLEHVSLSDLSVARALLPSGAKDRPPLSPLLSTSGLAGHRAFSSISYIKTVCKQQLSPQVLSIPGGGGYKALPVSTHRSPHGHPRPLSRQLVASQDDPAHT